MAFLALVGIAVAVYVLLGLSTCAVVAIATARVLSGGVSALAAAGEDVGPAVLVGGVMVAAILSGLWSLHRQLVATARLAREVRRSRVATDPVVQRLARDLGLEGRIEVVDAPDVISFTYGFVVPRVVVSAALVDAADDRELRAVLTHERYHVRQLDPLKTLAARTLTDAFFFLPVLRGLRRRYLVGRELAADRRVIDALGREPLAAALYRALTTPTSWQPTMGAAIGGFELLPARVSQLERGGRPDHEPLPARGVAVSVAAVGGLTAAAALSSGALPVGIARVHADMAGPTAGAMGITGAAICGAFVTWMAWHVVAWLTARRGAGGPVDPPAGYRAGGPPTPEPR